MRGRVLACAVVVACHAQVAQDHATGRDGEIEGAAPIALVDGGARVVGTISYPYGDRVDWWAVPLPRGQRGELMVELTWKQRGPGGQLALDVWNDDHQRVAGSETGKLRRQRSLELEDVAGTVFVRVYAVERRDGGAYTLAMRFVDRPPIDWLAIPVDEPPPLPRVPAPCEVFSRKDPACRDVCPSPPLADWPACPNLCPTPPDRDNPACWQTMPCPRPPDRRIRACLYVPPQPCGYRGMPCPDETEATGRVIKLEVQGSDVLVTVTAGSNQGVAKDWTAVVLRHGSDRPLVGGEGTIIRIDKRQTILKVALTEDQLRVNHFVRLRSPR